MWLITAFISIGSIIGASLVSHIPQALLKKILGVIILVIGLRIVIS